MREVIYERTKILELLPYGAEYLFVDRVLQRSEGMICTETTYSVDHPVLAAHFLKGPHLVPGAILCEQVCQSALLLAKLEDRIFPHQQCLLAKLECRFLQPVFAGCTVISEVKIDVAATRMFALSGHLEVDASAVAKVDIIVKVFD